MLTHLKNSLGRAPAVRTVRDTIIFRATVLFPQADNQGTTRHRGGDIWLWSDLEDSRWKECDPPCLPPPGAAGIHPRPWRWLQAVPSCSLLQSIESASKMSVGAQIQLQDLQASLVLCKPVLISAGSYPNSFIFWISASKNIPQKALHYTHVQLCWGGMSATQS